MRIKQLFLLAVALFMLMAVLASCELPFDLPFLNSATTEATTTTEPTTAPITTTTAASAAPGSLSDSGAASRAP